jgi:hypothetical protein
VLSEVEGRLVAVVYLVAKTKVGQEYPSLGTNLGTGIGGDLCCNPGAGFQVPGCP